MPTYDYKCQKCQAERETKHGVDEPGPSCCGESMQKVYTAVAAIFRGNGWGGKP